MPQIGSPIGTLLSSGAFLAVSLLPPESFNSWGWRLPFLAAFPLLGIALWIRRRVEESPLFEQLLREDELARSPVTEVFSRAFPQLLVGASSTLLGVGGFYLCTTFVISYGTEYLGTDSSVLLTGTLVAAGVEIVVLCRRAAGRAARTRPRDGGGRAGVGAGRVPGVLAHRHGVDHARDHRGDAGRGLPLDPLRRVRCQQWAVVLLLVVIALITAGSGALAPRLSLGHDEVVTG